MFAYDFTFFDQFPLNILVIWKYGSFIVALFGYEHFQNFENQFFKDEKTSGFLSKGRFPTLGRKWKNNREIYDVCAKNENCNSFSRKISKSVTNRRRKRKLFFNFK